MMLDISDAAGAGSISGFEISGFDTLSGYCSY